MSTLIVSGNSQCPWCISGEVSASRALALIACLRALTHFGGGSYASHRIFYAKSAIRYGRSHQYSCRVLRDISFPHSGQRLRSSEPFFPCQVVVRCLKYDFIHINFFSFIYFAYYGRFVSQASCDWQREHCLTPVLLA